LVYLLGVLDCEQATASTRMKAAIRSSERSLASLRTRVRADARRRAVRYYLSGLPVGLAIGLALTAVLANWGGLTGTADASVLLQCVVSGMIGAAVSVMVRVTRGRGIDVDSAQNRLMGVIAGAFRPLVGAIFGAVLYVLVTGQLVPLATPQRPETIGLFFVGLAFLAGFSERWAQDTIVQSMPRVDNAREERLDAP
jgi:heme O synthase-like polyprenyltransferase